MLYYTQRIERAQENDNKWWFILMLVFAVIFYIASLAGVVLLYVFFTEVSNFYAQANSTFFAIITRPVGVH